MERCLYVGGAPGMGVDGLIRRRLVVGMELDRMADMDRCLLRLAVYEMRYRDESF